MCDWGSGLEEGFEIATDGVLKTIAKEGRATDGVVKRIVKEGSSKKKVELTERLEESYLAPHPSSRIPLPSPPVLTESP